MFKWGDTNKPRLVYWLGGLNSRGSQRKSMMESFSLVEFLKIGLRIYVSPVGHNGGRKYCFVVSYGYWAQQDKPSRPQDLS